MPRRALAAVLTTVALLAGAGCGSGTTPAGDVPALATALDRVDEAVAAGKDDAARDALSELVDTTTAAREAGDLDADSAARILQTAEALLAALSDEPEPTEPTEPTLAPPPEEPEEVPDDEGDDEDETGKTKKDKTKKDTKDEDDDEDEDD